MWSFRMEAGKFLSRFGRSLEDVFMRNDISRVYI